MLQMGFAPVRMFPRLLLDNETSQHKDGVREVVKMLKKAGHTLGLRRNTVEKDRNTGEVQEKYRNTVEKNHFDKQTFADRALNTIVAGFEKHAEL